ncbi:SCO family protein [Tenacibaculum jejuense]|uniref:Probable cytochrome c oxidase biogenesis protein n=1 Tax=Tenacibaculum jejuense TaxID=584609 RepID=A0A238U4G2_9FLAO|nr:SCO family protein [Tenacibaculum jejuense]SNR14091.1 Probable cytochrome c oxidase biogenesis protein [Tenacibaculum jejuense]
MNIAFFKKSKYTFIFLIFFSIVALPCYYFLVKVEKRLPIYNPADVNPKLVDKSIRMFTKNHTISDFHLINQNGKKITQEDYKNKIYVADFFFATCKGICIPMATNMVKLQEHFENDDDIRFLSHTVMPEKDSVPALKAYSRRMGVIDGKWNVVTGDKKHIYELARKSYFAVLDEGDGGESDFIHTENFILIDKERRIRGIYDGTKFENMKQIIDDILLLKEEYE